MTFLRAYLAIIKTLRKCYPFYNTNSICGFFLEHIPSGLRPPVVNAVQLIMQDFAKRRLVSIPPVITSYEAPWSKQFSSPRAQTLMNLRFLSPQSLRKCLNF